MNVYSGLRIAVLTILCGLTAITTPRCVAQPAAPQVLTTVQEIRDLSLDQARSARPIRLRGVVTVVSGWKASFFLQDATSGISIDPEGSSPTVKPGEEVEVRGVTGPGRFAPVVTAQSVRVMGDGKMPHARVFSPMELFGGKEDSQYVAIRGLVRSAVVKTIWGRQFLMLNVVLSDGNLLTARVVDYSPAMIDRLPDSTVLIRGVCGTVFNDKRQFVGVRLFVASVNDVKIEKAASANPFEIPLRPVASVLRFDGQDVTKEDGFTDRVRVQGIVTYADPGKGFYLQDQDQAIYVQSEATPPAVTTRVEAVGYPALGRYSPKLDDAIFRPRGHDAQVRSAPVNAAGMIVNRDGFSAAPYDSMLVQMKGRLVGEAMTPQERVLIFTDGSSSFTARLPRTYDKRSFSAGSLMNITGICVAVADETHEARSFRIMLRSPEDLVVLEKGPWWTPAHAAWVVEVLVGVVIVMFVLLAVMRQQARLRADAVTDPLTGVYNRRGFLLLAKHQLQIALRRQTSLLLFYIDVDLFKEINDTYGHKEGDVALQKVSAILRDCFRQSDVIGRMGGDEFAIVVVDASASVEQVLKARLAELIAETNAKWQKPYQLSLSTGTLLCDGTSGITTVEELLAQADTVMYNQKKNRKGRHRSLQAEMQEA